MLTLTLNPNLGIVLYGGSLKSIMMFSHALSLSLPTLTKSIEELKVTYLSTRATYEDELPILLRSKEDAMKLQNDVSTRDYKKFEREVNSLRTGGGDAVSHVISALDPSHVKNIVGSLYRTALVGIAAVQNENIALVNMGANAGDIAYKRFNETISGLQTKFETNGSMKSISDKLEKLNWNKASLNFLIQGAGISLAYNFKEAAPIFSAAVVGSQMFTNTFDDLMDPVLSKLPEDIRSQGKVLLQSGLIYYGCFSQLLPGSSIPLPLAVPLAPFLGIEKLISGKLLK